MSAHYGLWVQHGVKLLIPGLDLKEVQSIMLKAYDKTLKRMEIAAEEGAQ